MTQSPGIRPLFQIAAAAAVLIFAGCEIPGRGGALVKPPKEPTGAVNRFVVQGPRITERSMAAVDVRNAYGPVRVVVDGTVARPVVETRLLFEGEMTDAQVDRIQKDVTVTARSVVGETRMILDAEVVMAAPHPGIRVEMTVRTPGCAGAIVRNANGGVELIGVSGDINVHSGVIGGDIGGGVRVVSTQPLHGPVKIATTFGDVEMFLPASSSGDLDLSSMDGEVVLTADVGRFTGTKQMAKRLTTSMNAGRNLYLVETMSGNVYVRLDDRDWTKGGAWR